MIRPDIDRKNSKTIGNVLFTTVKKTEKNPISPNFNPNNFKFYMLVGIHFKHTIT
jgi:hypothetical protein